MLKYSRELHKDLISGTKKAIAWGASADAILKIKQAPYPFESIVDIKAVSGKKNKSILNVPIVPPESLLNKDVSEYVIVIFADMLSYADAVLEDVNKIGNFMVVPTFCHWKQFEQEHMLNMLVQFLEPFHSKRKQLSSRCQSIKKVTLFINRLSRGGAEKQIVMLAVSLVNQGYIVCLITVKKDAEGVDDWCKLLQNKGVTRVSIPNISGNIVSLEDSLYEPLLNLFSPYSVYLIIQLTKILLQDKPDTLISYMPGNCLISALSGVLANIDRISLSFRNVAPISPSQDLYCYSTLAVAKDSMPFVFKNILGLPQVTITHNSAFGRSSYAAWMNVSEYEMKVVYNGLQAPQFSDLDIKQHHGINDENTVLVGVMRLVNQKRPLLFLQCVDELRKCLPNLRVFLVGDGPLRQDIMKAIVSLRLQNIVSLIGNHPTPTDYMRIADVLLHTAEFEGFPNVLLEAQVVGCPIVATDAGGSKEVFCEALLDICIAESDSPSSISQKLQFALLPKNVTLYKSYCKGVLKRFSLEALAENTIKSCTHNLLSENI